MSVQDVMRLFDDFETYYAAFPRKQAKGAARKVWAKAVRAAGSAQRIIEGAERYRDDPNREPGYTCLPATWLNQERWDDDPLPPKPKLNGHKPEPAPHVSVPFAQRKADEERARAERQRLLERLVVE